MGRKDDMRVWSSENEPARERWSRSVKLACRLWEMEVIMGPPPLIGMSLISVRDCLRSSSSSEGEPARGRFESGSGEPEELLPLWETVQLCKQRVNYHD
jgi:hypothetical protein